MAKVSIIVPTKIIDIYAMRCMDYCRRLCPEAELLVVTDEICPGLPAKKRNWAMQRATGDIFAFLDSDAYPSENWLKNSLFWLRYYPAVCGPGVLPPDAPACEKIADKVHQWMFCPYRVIPQEQRMVKWFPTFNLIVKREVATQFESFLTGEDDKFGEKIHGGIFYHPSISVFHNRRGAFRPLWRQFGQWGMTKGHFARLALIAYVTTLFTYAVNFVKGFFSRRIN